MFYAKGTKELQPCPQKDERKFRALDETEYLMINFLILIKTICYDPSSEPSHRDDSDEVSQHMLLCRINKNHPLLSPNIPSYLELW